MKKYTREQLVNMILEDEVELLQQCHFSELYDVAQSYMKLDNLTDDGIRQEAEDRYLLEDDKYGDKLVLKMVE